MSKEFPYDTTLGQITRGGTWDFDSPYNPIDFAQINAWGSPDNWTANQIKQFEAWDGHYSGTMHGPFIADDFEFGLQVPGVTELEIDLQKTTFLKFGEYKFTTRNLLGTRMKFVPYVFVVVC